MKLSLDRTSATTLRRFAMRLMLLALWAFFGKSGGLVTFSTLSLMFAILCSLIALALGEIVSLKSFNHWDEAILFLLLHTGVRIAMG